MITKICISCNIEKSVNEFYKHAGGLHGVKTKCKPCHVAQTMQYRKTNVSHEKLKEIARKSYAKNAVVRKAKWTEWRKNNLAYDAMRQRERRAKQLKAMPSWADRDAIKLMYANRPEGFHVDHIVPLKGKLVSGLHVEYNLQYLPATENLRKRNFHSA